jgi:hypothetical protein
MPQYEILPNWTIQRTDVTIIDPQQLVNDISALNSEIADLTSQVKAKQDILDQVNAATATQVQPILKADTPSEA